jgi:ParB family chromosome partitioning protein
MYQHEQTEAIRKIPLSELYPFENHPFTVRDDEAMNELVESVKENGIVHPGIARPRVGGGYEIIAGHRRKRACEIAGHTHMKVIIRELDDEEAVIIMADSNLLHREALLFSEKAFAYKMKADAIKRLAGRPTKDKGIDVDLRGKKSYELVGEQTGESKNQVYRFIRLTALTNELLKMVDEKKIGFNPAVELSYLTKDEQELLLDEIAKEEATPSLSQAQRMKQHSKDGSLTEEVMDEIMREEKKDTTKITLTYSRIAKYFPDTATPLQIEETIIKLLDAWLSRKQKTR